MVELDADPSSSTHRLTIRPNRSMSWPAMRNLFWLLFACLAVVALYFGQNGAWLVLPFAGLEALVLGIGIYLSARATARREVVEVNDQEISIHQGGRHLREVARTPRYWSQVLLRKDPHSWYPSRLFIISHGRLTEIGTALVESEREQLADDLRNLVDQRSGFSNSPQSEYPPALDTVGQQV